MKRAHVELKRRVQERCKTTGFTQNKVASEVRVDSGNFSRLLRGEGGVPGTEITLRMQQLLGVEQAWWFEEATESGEHHQADVTTEPTDSAKPGSDPEAA